MEWRRGEYLLTDEPARMNLAAVCRLLAQTDWAADRPRKVSRRAFAHSVCFGLFHRDRQVGFARAITDHATFTYICDVVVAPAHRGRGLGRWMIETLLAHPRLQTPTYALRTREARRFYEALGFQPAEYLRRSSRPL